MSNSILCRNPILNLYIRQTNGHLLVLNQGEKLGRSVAHNPPGVTPEAHVDIYFKHFAGIAAGGRETAGTRKKRKQVKGALSSESPLELNPPGSLWETVYVCLRLRQPHQGVYPSSSISLWLRSTLRKCCALALPACPAQVARESLQGRNSESWQLEMLSKGIRDSYKQGWSQRYKNYVTHLTCIYGELRCSG